MDILRPLPKIVKANQFVMVLTQTYSELTEALLAFLMRKITTTNVAYMLFRNWYIIYEIPT